MIGEEVSQFYFIFWKHLRRLFSVLPLLFVCDTGTEGFFTFKVLHELTGNSGLRSEREEKNFHMKNKLCHLFVLEHFSSTLST